MKLRVAKVSSNRVMAGEFLVQIKRWGLWHDMYFDSQKKTLREEQAVLGEGLIKRAIFDDFHEAFQLATKYKNTEPEKIREIWEV